MRIISGRYRRRKLQTNPGKTTRPITNRVKEMLFARLRDRLDGCHVADIFAGTGTLGIEALSRGASTVVFIENDHRAHELLKRNVSMLGIENDTLCWRTDVVRTSFQPKGVDGFLPYNVVFFDPPYRMVTHLVKGTRFYKSVERLSRETVTAPEALLVFRSPEKAEFDWPDEWHLEERFQKSSMQLHIFRKQILAAEIRQEPSDERT